MNISKVSNTNFNGNPSRNIKRIEGNLKDGLIGRLDFNENMYQLLTFTREGRVTSGCGEIKQRMPFLKIVDLVNYLDSRAEKCGTFFNEFLNQIRK